MSKIMVSVPDGKLCWVRRGKDEPCKFYDFEWGMRCTIFDKSLTRTEEGYEKCQQCLDAEK